MKSYSFQADVVRVLAILGVVGVHLVIPITARPDFFGGKIWWLTFLLNCLFRVSVPLFIMLSGYLSMGKNNGIKENLHKVFWRLVVPLVSYYALFNVIYARMAWLRHEPFDYWGIFHNLSKNTHTSLYFLVILAFIQLLNPLWNLLTDAKNSAILSYVIQFFLFLGGFAYVFYYVSLREGEVFSTFTLWMMWVGYYLYGFWVKTQPTTLTARQQARYLLLAVTGYMITVGFGYLTLLLYHRGLNDLFYIGGQTYADAYLSFSVMAMALSIFPLLMKSQWLHQLQRNQAVKKTTIFLASISFGLYLNHLIVIDVLNKFFGVTPDSPSMPGIGSYLLINTGLTFILTIPVTMLLKSLPGLKIIVGEK